MKQPILGRYKVQYLEGRRWLNYDKCTRLKDACQVVGFLRTKYAGKSIRIVDKEGNSVIFQSCPLVNTTHKRGARPLDEFGENFPSIHLIFLPLY